MSSPIPELNVNVDQAAESGDAFSGASNISFGSNYLKSSAVPSWAYMGAFGLGSVYLLMRWKGF